MRRKLSQDHGKKEGLYCLILPQRVQWAGVCIPYVLKVPNGFMLDEETWKGMTRTSTMCVRSHCPGIARFAVTESVNMLTLVLVWLFLIASWVQYSLRRSPSVHNFRRILLTHVEPFLTGVFFDIRRNQWKLRVKHEVRTLHLNLQELT